MSTPRKQRSLFSVPIAVRAKLPAVPAPLASATQALHETPPEPKSSSIPSQPEKIIPVTSQNLHEKPNSVKIPSIQIPIKRKIIVEADSSQETSQPSSLTFAQPTSIIKLHKQKPKAEKDRHTEKKPPPKNSEHHIQKPKEKPLKRHISPDLTQNSSIADELPQPMPPHITQWADDVFSSDDDVVIVTDLWQVEIKGKSYRSSTGEGVDAEKEQTKLTLPQFLVATVESAETVDTRNSDSIRTFPAQLLHLKDIHPYTPSNPSHDLPHNHNHTLPPLSVLALPFFECSGPRYIIPRALFDASLSTWKEGMHCTVPFAAEDDSQPTSQSDPPRFVEWQEARIFSISPPLPSVSSIRVIFYEQNASNEDFYVSPSQPNIDFCFWELRPSEHFTSADSKKFEKLHANVHSSLLEKIRVEMSGREEDEGVDEQKRERRRRREEEKRAMKHLLHEMERVEGSELLSMRLKRVKDSSKSAADRAKDAEEERIANAGPFLNDIAKNMKSRRIRTWKQLVTKLQDMLVRMESVFSGTERMEERVAEMARRVLSIRLAEIGTDRWEGTERDRKDEEETSQDIGEVTNEKDEEHDEPRHRQKQTRKKESKEEAEKRRKRKQEEQERREREEEERARIILMLMDEEDRMFNKSRQKSKKKTKKAKPSWSQKESSYQMSDEDENIEESSESDDETTSEEEHISKQKRQHSSGTEKDETRGKKKEMRKTKHESVQSSDETDQDEEETEHDQTEEETTEKDEARDDTMLIDDVPVQNPHSVPIHHIVSELAEIHNSQLALAHTLLDETPLNTSLVPPLASESNQPNVETTETVAFSDEVHADDNLLMGHSSLPTDSDTLIKTEVTRTVVVEDADERGAGEMQPVQITETKKTWEDASGQHGIERYSLLMRSEE
ncbi:hypothetical protein BLNAU_19833 [Blattamonas nauphoetae]|uniref:Uncharacterized protein n=1 Tax=Blattamonas nauphoetae TaxID=2049346 RepID=A0ABQ9X0E3_9EUKA|nr:hypothetical protein BLNAU_19833 [Blattamonas nauphoetae]